MKLKVSGQFLGQMLHHPIFLKIRVALESPTLILVPLLKNTTVKGEKVPKKRKKHASTVQSRKLEHGHAKDTKENT